MKRPLLTLALLAFAVLAPCASAAKSCTAPAYVAAKAALHGFGRALAWDAGGDGVLTNVVAVGFTRTETNQDRFPSELFERAGALTPQGRVSTGEDVARVVLWLGSDANTSITGEVIREGTSVARTPVAALT